MSQHFDADLEPKYTRARIDEDGTVRSAGYLGQGVFVVEFKPDKAKGRQVVDADAEKARHGATVHIHPDFMQALGHPRYAEAYISDEGYLVLNAMYPVQVDDDPSPSPSPS